MGYKLENYQILELRKAFQKAKYTNEQINNNIQYLQNSITNDEQYSIKLNVINEYSYEKKFILLSRNNNFKCNFNNDHTLDAINLNVTHNICNADIIFPDNNVIIDFKHTENMWKQSLYDYNWQSNSGFIILCKHVDKYYQQGKKLQMVPWLVVLIDDPDTDKQLVFVNINEAMEIFYTIENNNKIRKVDVYKNANYIFNKNTWYNQEYFWDYLRKNQK